MARRVEDLKLMLGVVEGFDPRDPASAPVSRRTERDKNNLRGLGVMWYAEDGVAPVTRATREAVRNAARALTDAGLEVIERRPQKLERAHELWFVWLGQGGTPGIVAMYDGKEDLMGPLVRELKRGALTNEPTLGQFLKAWFRRDGLRSSLLGEMQDHPIILAPVASVPAFRHEHEGDFDVEGQTVSYVKAFSYSQAFNLVGFPSAVVPCGRSPEGLPIGVQVVGRPFEEQTVLAVAEVLEQALGGYQRPPI
jgi:Asp-tRNA(Asn)/Glu-tRNA(Gln) amidotransferase A subunit family amidase